MDSCLPVCHLHGCCLLFLASDTQLDFLLVLVPGTVLVGSGHCTGFDGRSQGLHCQDCVSIHTLWEAPGHVL